MALRRKRSQVAVAARSRAREAQVVVERRLDASPHVVWDLLSTPEAERLMNPSAVRVGRLDDAVRGVGEIQVFVSREPGTTELRATALMVEEFDPPWHVVHSSLSDTAAGIRRRTTIDLAPAADPGQPDAGTVVRYAVSTVAPDGSAFADVEHIGDVLTRSIDLLLDRLGHALGDGPTRRRAAVDQRGASSAYEPLAERP